MVTHLNPKTSGPSFRGYSVSCIWTCYSIFLFIYFFFVDIGFMCVLLLVINDGLSQFDLHCQLRQSQ